MQHCSRTSWFVFIYYLHNILYSLFVLVVVCASPGPGGLLQVGVLLRTNPSAVSFPPVSLTPFLHTLL